ncbi:E3 ubiquitin-protein ligase FANCL isoform X3 [Macrosteles quadrilineatus]|uniref:E3 ubiquitin-protein ligase FANCL isoform X3 n=1 Tax=Macrosteles quadrilineatus TaxID=74068 RepID=UPI0023E23D5C|nr:E3 ubiquitin-protein ligase FANCL isoform X3 [Macrosteles quadrilineatus]
MLDFAMQILEEFPFLIPSHDFTKWTGIINVEVGLDSAVMVEVYARVLTELRQVGSKAVVDCSADLSRVTLHVTDTRGVDHQLIVGLSVDYPTSPATVVDADLPDVVLGQLFQARTVLEIMTSFEKLVELLQDFWIVYEELKRSTWIVDPENPRLKDTHCRIVVGENVSMLVTLNPQDTSSCPDLKFLGPDNLVTLFINSVENNLKTKGWDEDAGVCTNLLRILGLTQFPQRDIDTEVDTTQGECSICFTVRSGDDMSLAIKVCNNTCCDSYFHISCLAQWFQSVPTNEASFKLISGVCPSCGEKILCPIAVK